MLCSKKVYKETINPYYTNLIDWEYEYLENWTSFSHPFRNFLQDLSCIYPS